MRHTGAALAAALAVTAVLAAPPTGSAEESGPVGEPGFRAADALAGSPAVDALGEALRALALTPDDLSFRADYADHPDSFRITVVDRLLDRPMETESYVAAFADEVSSARSLEELVRLCARDLDLSVPPPDKHDVPESMEPKSMGPTALDVLVPAVKRAEAEIEAAFAALTEEQQRFIALHAASILDEEEFDPDKPIDEREREAEEEEVLADELLRIAGRVDYERLATAGAAMARAVDLAIPLAMDDPLGLPRARSEFAIKRTESSRLASGDVLNVTETAVGTVIIGGPGRTTYTGGAAVIIDIGGDDVYEGDVAAAMRDLPVSVVIDLSGDDVYRGVAHSLGAGLMGVGILADLEGDDTYSAGDFSLGSGLFGVGVLADEAGNDSYSGDTCTEGSGAFGIGVQRDAGGNDNYNAALFSQAFGFVQGAGLLHDASGNDVYFAGGKYTDEIRYFDHYISLSQGFGFGWRPDASGGIGMLVDGAGNDVYVSDIFGQGSSYWFAVGGLVDYSGNDQYVSYQYAQGAGTHITVAALVDCDGDDNYVSKGVSQGCGHDLAIGLLHDLAGNDNYTCHGLSQAAGNANGIGILMDDSGDDAYTVRDPDNTHGYGNLRRDYGSVGILLDCGGSDSYSGRGSEGSWWTGSVHGVGVDTETEEEADAPLPDGLADGPTLQEETEETVVDTIELAGLTPEELFLRASSSALQFEHLREPSRKILVRDHERAIPYLVTQLDTDDARERHALEDVLVRIGPPAVAPVIEALLAEAARPDTTRGVRLAAGVLGRLGDPAAIEPLDSVHGHPDWKVRGAIGGALGRIGTAEAVGPLVSMLADRNEVVRKSAAVGLRRVAVRGTDEEEPDVAAFRALNAPVIQALVRALGDRHYSVRHSASDALARIGEPALTLLMEVVETGTGEARLMALRAVGAIGSQETLKVVTAALDDPDWAVRAHAAAAIGEIGPDRRARRTLERLAEEDGHPVVVSSAAAALERPED